MTTSTLYQIQAQYRDILDRLEQSIQADELTPDELDALNAELAINQAEFVEKADAYAAVIRQKAARAEFLKSEAKRLVDLAKSEEAISERLWQRISDAMLAQGLTKAETPHFKLGFRKSASVEVTVEAEALPVLYQRTKLIYEADKVALKKALQLGDVIPGARLVERQSLQIR